MDDILTLSHKEIIDLYFNPNLCAHSDLSNIYWGSPEHFSICYRENIYDSFMTSYARMRANIKAEKNRPDHFKLSWWWRNCIFECTSRVWVSGEYLKISRTAISVQAITCIDTLATQVNIIIYKMLSQAALSIWAIGCIGYFTTQVNIRRSGELLWGSFHLKHRSYRYVNNTGKY